MTIANITLKKTLNMDINNNIPNEMCWPVGWCLCGYVRIDLVFRFGTELLIPEATSTFYKIEITNICLAGH